MKRRFWEQDDRIYGGLTYTNQPNAMIGYPMWDYFSKGKGVLLGTYLMGAGAFVASAKPPEQRIKDALDYGEKVHPGQYKAELRMRRGGGLASRALDARLLRPMDRGGARGALQRCLCPGRAHRAGGRAYLAPARLAGRGGDIGDGRDDAPACQSHGCLMAGRLSFGRCVRRDVLAGLTPAPRDPVGQRPKIRRAELLRYKKKQGN